MVKVPLKIVVKPDHELTEMEYVDRHLQYMADRPEADNYLRMRYRWLKGQQSYIPVIEAYNQYDAAIQNI